MFKFNKSYTETERIVNIIHLLIVVVRSICGIINNGALRITKENLCEKNKALFYFFFLSSFFSL